MWHAAGRSALAASRSPRAPTTSPPSARPGRRMYSRPWPTPPPCSTPSSREPALGLAGGRARSQGTDRRSRWAARRAGARGRDARLSGRHDRPTVRSGPYADEARSGAAAARVSTGRRQSEIEHAIAATGLARDRFLPESLPYFVAQFEARTGRAALLAR